MGVLDGFFLLTVQLNVDDDPPINILADCLVEFVCVSIIVVGDRETRLTFSFVIRSNVCCLTVSIIRLYIDLHLSFFNSIRRKENSRLETKRLLNLVGNIFPLRTDMRGIDFNIDIEQMFY